MESGVSGPPELPGRQPEELARELGVSGQSLRNWLKQADIDEGVRKDGLTSEERGELIYLRPRGAPDVPEEP